MVATEELAWDGPASARRIYQDIGPWTWFLAEAWQQAAAPDLYNGVSRRPLGEPRSMDQLFEAHGAWIAYWGPFLHLTTLGLGWATPEVGLWEWNEMGRPTDDPVLSTISRRYGDDVELMTTWLCTVGPALRSGVFGHPWQPAVWPAGLASRNRQVEQFPLYQATFTGGADSQHLLAHVREYEAGGPKPIRRRISLSLGGGPVDYLLIGEQYRTLFASLHSGVIPSQTDGRSTRVGLVCPSIGWLGSYRQSRTTGLWFRGRHRWHALGNGPLAE